MVLAKKNDTQYYTLNGGLAIKKPERVCFNCLKRVRMYSDRLLNKIEIPALGYGGQFDGFSTKLILCNTCYKNTNPLWWELEVVEDGYIENYKYEQDILNFINNLPIEGQELFWNRFGTQLLYMEPQDWIDYELGILPPDKQKKYGLHIIDTTNAKGTIDKENDEVIKFIYNKNEGDNLIIGGQIIIEALIELIKKERGL